MINLKITVNDLKTKYANYEPTFQSTFDEVVNKALLAQSLRDPHTSKVYFKSVADSYYPYLTPAERKVNSSRYSDTFSRRKHLFASTWKHSLPNVFEDTPTIQQDSSSKKLIEFVDMSVEEDSNTELYTITISSNESDKVSCKYTTVSSSMATKIIKLINEQIFSIL